MDASLWKGGKDGASKGSTVASLYELSVTSLLNQIDKACELVNLLRHKEEDYLQEIKYFRRYLRKNLPFNVLSDLFDRLFPRDLWTHPCTDPGYLNFCHMHWECRLLYNRMPLLIRMMFSEDITSVQLNVKKVQSSRHKELFTSFQYVLTKLPSREFPLLNTFIISGGGRNLDKNITEIEELSETLRERAPNLFQLHLPLASNIVLNAVSRMGSLRVFVCERSTKLDKRGLQHLCASMSATKYKLEVLHLGVFRHKNFSKESITFFLKSMEALRDFSFRDRERFILHSPLASAGRDKVLSYSVFKMAIKEHDQFHGNRSDHPFVTNLREMCIVDRSLKPHYLLESAPQLHRLTIDWQEELSMMGHDRFPKDWFTEMLSKPSWVALSQRLTKLDITFPAAYSPNSYGLPVSDFMLLTAQGNLSQLKQLRLVGAGMMGPLPLIPTLRACPELVELELEKTPIFICQQIVHEYIHTNLRKFSLLNELSSLTNQPWLTRSVSVYMPNLRELIIQPQVVVGYNGLLISQIRELNRLKYLVKLSMPVSTLELSNNPPTLAILVKGFNCLRNLILSWSSYNSDTVTKIQISYSMSTLIAMLEHDRHLNMQLSLKHHPQDYIDPTSFRW